MSYFSDAEKVLRDTEKALKKHLGLVKKRERITSVVAMLERIRGDIALRDEKACQEHLKRLNELTQGFVQFSLKGKKKK